MKRRARGPLIGGLALAMVATLGGTASLTDQDPARTGQVAGDTKDAAGGLLSRLGDAARGLVNGGSGRAAPEIINAGLARDEKPVP
ncbi:hypothetical protein ACL02O_24290, partial [Micromonospora sp. MS34]|uniref:hypothetical protein n=1 Tax=Micromonospora sp. MS34 TaxID=3385971 RepID=UPI0039A36232